MNIILVTVDSLRADHCGWQGEATTTSNLDEHADHSEAFGEHGTYGLHPVRYEENVHVPLLIHGAGRNVFGHLDICNERNESVTLFDHGGAGRHRKGTLNTVVTEMSGNT